MIRPLRPALPLRRGGPSPAAVFLYVRVLGSLIVLGLAGSFVALTPL